MLNMNNNGAILQHIWDTYWNLGPAASNCKRARDRSFSTSGQHPGRSSPSKRRLLLSGGVSHRRERPVDDLDGAKALLGWSGLTEEEAMEWGHHISHPPVPGTWCPGTLLQSPTHARGHQQASSAKGRTPSYRGTRTPASKAIAVPRHDIGPPLLEGRPCRPWYRLMKPKDL
jgi:hypothetical protein